MTLQTLHLLNSDCPIGVLPRSPLAQFRAYAMPGEEQRNRISHMLDQCQDGDQASPDFSASTIVREFFRAARNGDAGALHYFFRKGFPVNSQDPCTGETALHVAAGSQARKVLRILLALDETDHLIRDKKGRLPSEVAYIYGEDPAMARLLAIKERKQADKQGITLTRRPVSAS